MTHRAGISALVISASLFVGVSRSSAQVSLIESIQGIRKTIEIARQELEASHFVLNDGFCRAMQDQLDKARAKLDKAKKDFDNALKNPPKGDNAASGVTRGWVRFLQAKEREIKEAESALDEAQKSLDELCPKLSAVPRSPDQKPPDPPKGGGKPVRPIEGPAVPTFDPRFPIPGAGAPRPQPLPDLRKPPHDDSRFFKDLREGVAPRSPMGASGVIAGRPHASGSGRSPWNR